MVQIDRRHALIAGAGVGVVGAVAYAAAGYLLPEVARGGAFFAQEGVAIRGADPVAYFTQRAPVIGSPEFSHTWSGVTWHFANEAHLAAFAADPEKYAPQFGGYCAWAVAAKGELYSTQPENWSIVDDKLYLNFNDRVQEVWDEDRPGFISEGQRRWPDLRDTL